MALSTPKPAFAIALILSAIFCFGLMDVAVKAASVHTSVVIILCARYSGQLLIVLMLKASQLPQLIRTRHLGLQVARSVFLLLATAFFFLALGHIGLAQATAIMALNPVLITLGGALFLGEALGARRIAAIIAALAGALIVIQPGSQVFQPAALLPLAGAACFAGHALITRSLGPGEDVWTSMLYTGIVGAAIMATLVPFEQSAPSTDAVLMLIAVGMLGTAGQVLLVRAFSLAEAGVLAPFIYTGLIWAMLWGVVLFGERPDAATVFGALVIAGAGIYVWHRETQTR